MEILDFKSLVEMEMEFKTRETRIHYLELIYKPQTPETITAIDILREEYNHFMNDCYRLLKEEEQQYKQPLLN
jgi:hypothetical protein